MGMVSFLKISETASPILHDNLSVIQEWLCTSGGGVCASCGCVWAGLCGSSSDTCFWGYVRNEVVTSILFAGIITVTQPPCEWSDWPEPAFLREALTSSQGGLCGNRQCISNFSVLINGIIPLIGNTTARNDIILPTKRSVCVSFCYILEASINLCGVMILTNEICIIQYCLNIVV